MKTILKWLLLPVAIVLGISFALGLITQGIKGVLGGFNIDLGQDWRETVSTDNGIKGTTNGGLTIKEIEDFEELSIGRPYYEDIFKKSVVIESNNYVTIYRQIDGTDNYYNLNFVKTDKGLVYDGAIGVYTKVPVHWVTGYRYFNEAKTTLDTTLAGYSGKNIDFWEGFYKTAIAWTSWFASSGNENVVTFSDFNTNFAKDFNLVNAIMGPITQNSASRDLFLYITEYLATNVMYPHFQKMTDSHNDIIIEMKTGLENIDSAELVKKQLNTFATYLWKNSKSENKENKNTIVDASDYFVSFIPENLQVNYPLLSDDKSTFAGFDYYPIYDNKVYFESAYFWSNSEPKRDVKKIEKDKDIVEDKGNIGAVEQQEIVLAKLSLILNNRNNADLSSINFKTNPILIAINDRFIVIDSRTKFNQQIALAINTHVNWSINSSSLLFDSYSGILVVSELAVSKTFDFDYYNNQVPVNVKLHAISGLDISDIDLTATPVTIALVNTGTNETKTFRFNDNNHFQTGITQLLSYGNYNYTIVSSKLSFNELSGSFEINELTREILFTFWVEESTVNYKLGYSYGNLWQSVKPDMLSMQNPFLILYLNQSMFFDFDNLKIMIFDSQNNALIKSYTINDLSMLSDDTDGKYLYLDSSEMVVDKPYTIQFVLSENSGLSYSHIAYNFYNVFTPNEQYGSGIENSTMVRTPHISLHKINS